MLLLLKSVIGNLYFHAFSKCHHLDPLLQFESGFASQGNEEDYNLDIFEITMNISELVKKFVKKKLVI
jgi:hypothetical protein